MDEETRAHKERLLGIYQENLRELETRAAKFGFNTPLFIINEIKDHRKNIDELRIQLHVNAEEVTFDKLLVGIEDLQRFVREEGVRAVKEYQQAFGDDVMLGFSVLGLVSAGILATVALAYLYQEYIRGVYLSDPYNILLIAIIAIGLSFSIYLSLKRGNSIHNSKYRWFVHRMGYDPFDRKSQ